MALISSHPESPACAQGPLFLTLPNLSLTVTVIEYAEPTAKVVAPDAPWLTELAEPSAAPGRSVNWFVPEIGCPIVTVTVYFPLEGVQIVPVKSTSYACW